MIINKINLKMKNKRTNNKKEEEVMVTDLLANLCTELATMFYSLSRITKVCLGLKDQLTTQSLSGGDSIQSPLEENCGCIVNSDNYYEQEKSNFKSTNGYIGDEESKEIEVGED